MLAQSVLGFVLGSHCPVVGFKHLSVDVGLLSLNPGEQIKMKKLAQRMVKNVRRIFSPLL